MVCGVVVVLFLWSAIIAAQPAEPHIVNSDFEQGFTVRESPEVRIAVGWDYDYLPEDRWCEHPCKRPEFTEESGIVSAGNYSQRWFGTFARTFGVIHQSIDVEAGEWYEFSCQVYVISEPDGQNAAFVGVNPWNGGVFDRTMIWGQQQPWGLYREWVRVSVTAQAWSDKIRVVVGANNNWATHNNASYVDNCTIRRVDFADITPQPTTPCPTPQPCPTCIPDGDCSCASVEDVATIVAGREPVVWPR
jgi:hypothetical protein